MASVFTLLPLGFLLGMRHATDADHVVAVTTMVAREGSVRTAARIGAVWGLGHTLTILVVGGAIIAFDLTLPARVGLSLELVVAAMLVGLGAWNVARVRRAHAGERHDDARVRGERLRQTLRSLAIGCVHGLAGSAAVALMVLATIRSVRTAILYLLVFGVGTVAGMMLVTSAMALPMALASKRFDAVGRHLAWTSGVLSIGLGLALAYQIGIVDGLFTGHAH